MRVTRRRLHLGDRLPALGEQVTLVDLVVDEVPREELLGIVRAVHEVIGIDEAQFFDAALELG